jgi:hypothetical protein
MGEGRFGNLVIFLEQNFLNEQGASQSKNCTFVGNDRRT